MAWLDSTLDFASPDADSVATRDAFLRSLNELQALSGQPECVVGFARAWPNKADASARHDFFAMSAELILCDPEVDLILAAGAEAAQELAEARLRIAAPFKDAGAPVLALTPDCLPAILTELQMEQDALTAEGADASSSAQPSSLSPSDAPGSAVASPAPQVPERIMLFSPLFWSERLADYAAALGFKRLGVIAPPSALPPDAAAATQPHLAMLAQLSSKTSGQAILHSAETLADAGTFELFSYADLIDLSPEQCREAVDYLFFDDIDALLLDGSGCFEPGRADYAELMELLRLRGIFALSLNNKAHAGQGALLAPGPDARNILGRALAAQAWAYFTGSKADTLFQSFGPPAFALDMDVAARLGFEPSAALQALSGAKE